jgi:putative tryptophan/tyrosine transport system substrate-binding protein
MRRGGIARSMEGARDHAEPVGWRPAPRRTTARFAAMGLWLMLLVLDAHTPAWPQANLPRVGIMWSREGAALPVLQVFERVLGEQGWVAGKTVILDYSAPRSEESRFAEAADELVRRKVDVIYAPSAPAMHAAAKATRSIPIVTLDYTTDPIAAGYIQSYARPGKNVTGVFLDAPLFASKWIEILKAINPRLTRVAVLWDPSPAGTMSADCRTPPAS